jgi:hypothetical protein
MNSDAFYPVQTVLAGLEEEAAHIGTENEEEIV